MGEEIKIKSLFKALKVLECFSVDKPELGIVEISEQLGLYKSVVYNFVDTFVKAGYMEKNEETGKYLLGFKILQLSNIISSNLSIRTLILPYMQELSDMTGEVTYVAVPSDGEVVYLDSCRPKNQMATRSMLGVKAQMYCTGIGKAMLAFLPHEFIERIIAKGLHRFTDNTVTDPDALRKEMADIRDRGYSVDNMEHEFGIKCVGVPIRNKKREVIAGISIAGPSLRFDEGNILEYSQLILRSVQSIEVKL